ncbi:PaaI family thioesterase [Mycobacterium sp. CBMA293]|uniref:PaaI family thioesterase n=1 Tax=unclassified Mycolicibacterium TaxID=2636767 RepID=UPI0012DC176F|nr:MULTISPECIES: PaaI family thioesterase [unclassified Mycolicibacterium]MUL49438.1 PaaI family thioesterase [Mycolicibacterium sp. CBMA 360]MUL57217.1 PaaI family thioesterase [Mycolicibacterium sp. CBMA 335]MUL70257.1 PaaI family thioesterase [Mycolicibacterium sp. CBMA 311]MUL92305.1 PaaI family thioesterase [Mycolicibacterium sp. CBMA 230]MUM06726.1 aromatic compound degradation protein PaaI [Mycolicibacterium sp. CBMA 213]
MSGQSSESDQFSWVGGDFQSLPKSDGDVPLCGACRPTGLCRLGVRQEELTPEKILVSDIVCPADHEGGPNVAHGGWTAGVLDEILGHVPLHHDQLSVTATLTVNFRKPVPVGRPLRARAWVDKIDGQKWYISGELVLSATDSVLATATGIWVARDAAHFSRHQKWLAEQDAAASAAGGNAAEAPSGD